MKVITIGRIAGDDRIVIKDPHVSRHHLQIIQHDDGHFSLKDFGSTNGTYVDGCKICGKEVDLAKNAVVRIGSGTPIPWLTYFDSENIFSEQESSTVDLDAPTPAFSVSTRNEEKELPFKKNWLLAFCFVALFLGLLMVARSIVYYREIPPLYNDFVFVWLERISSVVGLVLTVMSIVLMVKIFRKVVDKKTVE